MGESITELSLKVGVDLSLGAPVREYQRVGRRDCPKECQRYAFIWASGSVLVFHVVRPSLRRGGIKSVY